MESRERCLTTAMIEMHLWYGCCLGGRSPSKGRQHCSILLLIVLYFLVRLNYGAQWIVKFLYGDAVLSIRGLVALHSTAG